MYDQRPSPLYRAHTLYAVLIAKAPCCVWNGIHIFFTCIVIITARRLSLFANDFTDEDKQAGTVFGHDVIDEGDQDGEVDTSL